MPIAALYNVPSTPSELNVWACCHAAHHRDIASAIFTQYNVIISEYVLDPLNPADIENWANGNQILHNQINGVLGFGGFDLLEIDLQKPNELAGWIQAHVSEHINWCNALGVG